MKDYSAFAKKIKARNRSLDYVNTQGLNKKVLPVLAYKVNNSCMILSRKAKSTRTDPPSRASLANFNKPIEYNRFNTFQSPLLSSDTQ